MASCPILWSTESTEVVEALIAAGADLSLQNVDGQTAADLAPTETKGEVDEFNIRGFSWFISDPYSVGS